MGPGRKGIKCHGVAAESDGGRRCFGAEEDHAHTHTVGTSESGAARVPHGQCKDGGEGLHRTLILASFEAAPPVTLETRS